MGESPSHLSVIRGALLQERYRSVCCACPEVVRYSGAECIASTGIAVGTSTEVRYKEDVRYWKGPLSEVPLYGPI